MDTVNANLSKRLHEVLDVIGASEYMRTKYWELAMLEEIGFTFVAHFYDKTADKESLYRVGSKCEGTTTPGYISDIDKLVCREDRLVVEYVNDAKQKGRSYLILTDNETKPGYVRLQIVEDKCLLTCEMCDALESSEIEIDREGRVFAKHIKYFAGPNTIRNGPAYTFPATHTNCETDFVSAYKFRQIPMSAKSWMHRPREYDWPSQKQLKAMGSFGCFLVGVGYCCSDNESFEWRISFTLQERYLMSSLNETQHKCYILLKLIKKDIIKPKAGDSISSYHCKTCMFYTIENSQNHCWTADNLIHCARHCLKRLLIWVMAKCCPNYCIPGENMFDKVSLMALHKVENVLKDIIDRDDMFVYSINSDNVGELLKSKLCGSEPVKMSTMLELDPPIPRNYSTNADCVYVVRNEILENMRISCNTNIDYLNATKQLLLYLRNTNYVTVHTTRDVRMALDSIIPHIQLQYEHCMFVQYLLQGDVSRLRPGAIPNVISESSDCDLISSKLSLVSARIKSRLFEEECERMLDICEISLEPYVISVCDCYNRQHYPHTLLTQKLRFTDMTCKYFRRHFTTGCMAFLPSQVSLVNEALQYELFRNVYTKLGSGFEMRLNGWLFLITVDSQIYLYFLRYLLYYLKTDKQTKIDTTVVYLLVVLLTDLNIGHRETGFNLLGWICLQENDLQSAWFFVCKSWAIRPFRNAAKWHMLIVLSEIIKGRQDEHNKRQNYYVSIYMVLKLNCNDVCIC